MVTIKALFVSKVFQALCNLQGAFFQPIPEVEEKAEKPNPPHAKVNLNVVDWVGKVRQFRRSLEFFKTFSQNH